MSEKQGKTIRPNPLEVVYQQFDEAAHLLRVRDDLYRSSRIRVNHRRASADLHDA